MLNEEQIKQAIIKFGQELGEPDDVAIKQAEIWDMETTKAILDAQLSALAAVPDEELVEKLRDFVTYGIAILSAEEQRQWVRAHIMPVIQAVLAARAEKEKQQAVEQERKAIGKELYKRCPNGDGRKYTCPRCVRQIMELLERGQVLKPEVNFQIRSMSPMYGKHGLKEKSVMKSGQKPEVKI